MATAKQIEQWESEGYETACEREQEMRRDGLEDEILDEISGDSATVWDEGLINAVGREAAARELGITADDFEDRTEAFRAACTAYNDAQTRGWNRRAAELAAEMAESED